MSQFNIAEAKAHFSELVQKAALGEEIVIARGNKPLARIVPFAAAAAPRAPGSAKGQIHMAEDFDALPPGFEEYA